MTTVKLGTQNVGRIGVGDLKMMADAGCHAYGAQEMGDHQTTKPPPGYEVWRPDDKQWPNGVENPIFYRADLDVFRRGSRLATPAHDVPRGVAGASRTGRVHAHSANWILFRLDGEVFFFCNNHCVPSIQYDVTRRLHRRHMGVLADMCKRRKDKANVVFTGDLNAEWKHNNYDVIRNAGMTSNWAQDNHPAGTTFPGHSARIDHKLYLPGQLDPVEQELVENRSDHNGLVVTFQTR